MFSIFKTVKATFDREFSKYPEEFRKGFLACFELFRIGYERTTLINYEAENLGLRKELESVNVELVRRKKDAVKIAALEKNLKALIENTEPDSSAVRRKMRLKLYFLVNARKADADIVKDLRQYVSGWNHA
ncbi:MAG TPA: hypothetical protein VI757_02595 [Bacteroidia bacterium]|nr:hypothetical protein [Bacteroidia bacterium]